MLQLPRVGWRLSSLVKTEPLQIVPLLLLLSLSLSLSLLLLFETRSEARKCLCQQSPVQIGTGSPRWRRTLHHRGLALNSKRPAHRHSRHTVRILVNCASRPAQQGHHRPRVQKVLQLRDLHSFLTSEPSGICRSTTTDMSTTVSSFNELQLWDLDCLLTDCTRGTC